MEYLIICQVWLLNLYQKTFKVVCFKHNFVEIIFMFLFGWANETSVHTALLL